MGMDETEINEFLVNYYRAPHPERLPQVLLECTKVAWFLDVSNSVAWYFIARIAQAQPALLRSCEVLFRKIPAARPALLQILKQAGDDRTRGFLETCLQDQRFETVRPEIQSALQPWAPGSVAPLSHPAQTPADLDLLWFEFLATGNTLAVVAIIDALEVPDRIRFKLESWLRAVASEEQSTLFASVKRRWIEERLRKKLAILVDPEHGEVITARDLGCYFAMDGFAVSQERLQKLTSQLPFPISEELTSLAVKAPAKWSLASNAQKHAIVLSTCKSEAAKRTGRSRLALLETVAHAELAQNDLQTAFEALQESLTTNPEERLAQIAKASAEWEILSRLIPAAEAAQSETIAGGRDAARECADATEAARIYRSKLVVTNISRKKPGPGDVSWEVEFGTPAKSRVLQTMWLDDSDVYDEWVTIGREHYRGPAYAPLPYSKVKHTLRLDRNLRAAKYLPFLRELAPASVRRLSHEGAEFVQFEYKDVIRSTSAYLPLLSMADWCRWLVPREWRALGPFAALVSGAVDFRNEFSVQACLWAECSTNRLVKAKLTFEVHPKGRSPEIVELEQFFACYDEPVSVVPPAFQLLQSGPAVHARRVPAGEPLPHKAVNLLPIPWAGLVIFAMLPVLIPYLALYAWIRSVIEAHFGPVDGSNAIWLSSPFIAAAVITSWTKPWIYLFPRLYEWKCSVCQTPVNLEVAQCPTCH